MGNLERLFRCAVASLALLLLWTPSLSHAETLPARLLGRWQVAEVHINTEATRTPQYGWNDPQLRWRIFAFAAAQMSDDTPESGDCKAPQATIAHMDLARLIGGSMAGSFEDDSPERATPAGYELKIGPAEAADVISIQCQGGLWNAGLGVDGGLMGAWMYIAPDGRLVLRWYDETILVLAHLDADAKPHASFDCARAASPTEKTICSSLQLASFDRSVASAYEIAQDQLKDEKALAEQLVSSQKAWMRRRDACASDSKCLLASMKKRMDELAAVNQE
jgi:uncharacterized protein YecT (DUF1311 family)